MSLAGRYWQHGCTSSRSSGNNLKWLFRGMRMNWTPNKVTLLRELVGFAAEGLFGRGAGGNREGGGLTGAWGGVEEVGGCMKGGKRTAVQVGEKIEHLSKPTRS